MKSWNSWDNIFVCVAVVLIGLSVALPLKNYNNQALFYRLKKNPQKAEQKWRQALSQQPFFPFYRMNLALLYLAEKQSEKALKENKITQDLLHLFQIDKIKTFNFTLDKDRLKLSPWPKFFWKKSGKALQKNEDIKGALNKRIFFNSALMATQQGDIEKALDFYQKALQFEPESLKIKTNIELLLAQVQHKKQNDKQNDKENQKQDEQNQKEEQGAQGAQEEKREQEEQDGKDQKENNNEEKDQKQGETQEEQAGKDSEESNKEENKKQGEEGEKNQKEENKKQGRGTGQRGKQNWNQQQTEAVLKSILEQEKKIQERRNREKKRPNRVEKDW